MDVRALVLCFAICGSALARVCDDIDTDACKLLASSRPDLCSDATLAPSACPRFCKLCPLECYNCNATVLDYHDCNTTMLCATDEVCMRKELKSFVDGHHEYHMTCERKEVCDGTGIVFPFGKRDIQSRDVSVNCCSDDLCNYPEVVIPITVCNKDVVFMIDQSASVTFEEFRSLLAFLFHVVQPMNISTNENMIGLYTYDVSVHEIFPLDRYTSLSSILNALTHDIHPSTQGLSTLPRVNTDEAVQYILQNALTPSGGDRTLFEDVVVIIADTSTAQALNSQLKQQLDQTSKDVIVISIGPDTGNNGVDLAATDSSHVIHVSSYDAMKTDTSIQTQLLNLIKKCQ